MSTLNPWKEFFFCLESSLVGESEDDHVETLAVRKQAKMVFQEWYSFTKYSY